MTVYVFVGPTLAPEEGRAVLDAVYLPPVAQADVYRVARGRPRAIGIVDGYFERMPAVWHKEILWAMAQGVHVYGAASMGALRAAELAAFGMEGVGRIFEAYRDGALEDDDEVAVAHGPAEDGYRAQSEAMVNVRATLAAAEAAGVVAPATRASLEAIAKGLFYPERVYARILGRGAEEGLPAAELSALRAWLPANRVDQKRADALAMLATLRDWLAQDPEPKRVRYHFEHTVWWDEAARHASLGGIEPNADAAGVGLPALLDELRLEGRAESAYRSALARHLALDEAHRRGIAATIEAMQATAAGFRRQRDLLEPAALERWLAEQHLTAERFRELIREEVLLLRADELLAQHALRRLPDHLRVSGDYARLVARARAKQQALAAHGLQDAAAAPADLLDRLLAWHCARRGEPLPASLDDYARRAGFAAADECQRALLREYHYVQLTEAEDAGHAADLNG
jgi:hypothetical protein